MRLLMAATALLLATPVLAHEGVQDIRCFASSDYRALVPNWYKDSLQEMRILVPRDRKDDTSRDKSVVLKMVRDGEDRKIGEDTYVPYDMVLQYSQVLNLEVVCRFGGGLLKK